MVRKTVLTFIQEPIVHFLIIGAGIFTLYLFIADPADMRPDRIIVDETNVSRLAEQFQRTWMRSPTKQELKGLIDEFVKEEILYREALALGLDQNDLIIRRRLRQKMEFLNEDVNLPRAPSDVELHVFYNAHLEHFRRPDRISFQQIYLNPNDAADSWEQTAVELMARLNGNLSASVDPGLLGDRSLLPNQLAGVTKSDIAKTFGDAFVKGVEQATTGRWCGPYASSFGLHLIRVQAREAGGVPAMAEIRPILEREWLNMHRNEAKDRYYRQLLERYDVEIRLPAEDSHLTLAVR